MAVEVLAGAIAWTSLAIWLGRALQTSHSRVRATGHTLFVLSHVGITTVSYVLIDEITSGWLFINIWHICLKPNLAKNFWVQSS